MLGLLYALAFCIWTIPALQDEVSPHIIKTRSIDLNNAFSLATENRIDNKIVPTGYVLKLEPNFTSGEYEGRVHINVTWNSSSDDIVLHCSPDVEITLADLLIECVDSPGVNTVLLKRLERDPKKSTIRILFEQEVGARNKGIMKIGFKGRMQRGSSEGFFISTYNTDTELDRIVAATQFRPTNARKMFPCFDEPEYKVPFEVSVVRQADMIALGNMPVERTEELKSGDVRVYFKRTPPMSTYTLGLLVGHLSLVNSIRYNDSSLNKLEIRVWGRSDYRDVLETVADRVQDIMGVVKTYQWPPLPLRKIDIVALPNYQGVKPADNWGLIVFKESDLGAGRYMQLTQELLHQWLGGMVTPAWWSEAHLNKALVAFLAVEAAYKINDGSEMEGKWPMTVLYSLYYEYSKRYPHSRITGMKQETLSTKIELLLRMFNYTLGEETFKKGLRIFFRQRAYSTFEGNHVWEALNKSAAMVEENQNINVQKIANSWIEKDRLPLVTVKRNYEEYTATVSQKLYLRERPHDVPGAERMLWWIPLVVVSGDCMSFNSTTPVAWMSTQSIEITNLPSKEDFIIVNPEEIAPYPVNYDEDNWNLISEFLKTENRTLIPELTRAKVLHDAWNLAFAGELSFATAFNMTLFLQYEETDVVWDPVFTMINHLDRHIWDIRDKFDAYIISLLSPLYEKLSENAEELDQRKKNMLSLFKTFLCQAGYKPCITEVQEQYSKWMLANNPDEGNPVSDMYFCPVFQWGTQEEWEFGLQRVINFPPTRKQSERTYLLKTLSGCLRDKSKITRLLNITLIEENGNFTEMDLFMINNMFSHSPQAYTTLFHFIEDNWDVIKEKYYNRTNLWSHLISTATTYFTTKSGLELVTGLYKAHQGEFGPAEHIIEKSIRNIKEESRWTSHNVPIMEKWLDSYLERNAITGITTETK
ncbi:endoplasmic reticulum aminopeptidase 2 [Battus philenor]|uniref:endoplasmic reticulum aminopeptidase 2 n=1 Tax=Battus philenor TaxID=42288 RepID=UPI0035D12441